MVQQLGIVEAYDYALFEMHPRSMNRTLSRSYVRHLRNSARNDDES